MISEKDILNLLVDIYENKKPSSNRLARLDAEKKIPELRDPKKYIDPNDAIKRLEDRGYIKVIRNKNSNIPEKLILREDKIEDIYVFLNRESQKSKNQKLLDLIEKYKDSCPTNNSFCNFLFDAIKANKKSKYREKGSFLSILMEYIRIIENNKDIIYQDEMSALVSGCTTHSFKENYSSEVQGIFREFGSYPKSNDIKDILKKNNIIQKNYVIKMKGSGVIHFKSGDEFSLKNLAYVFGISNNDVDGIVRIDTDKLITVENETVFDSIGIDNALILFCSGFIGRAEAELIKKIEAREYLHTGDIDAGGILIMEDIIEKTGINFHPYMMDTETYKRYLQKGEELTYHDIMRLNKIKKETKINEFRNLIDLMIKEKKKIEQEHIWMEIRQNCILQKQNSVFGLT